MADLVTYHAIRTSDFDHNESLYNTVSSESTALCKGPFRSPKLTAGENNKSSFIEAVGTREYKVPNGSPPSGRKQICLTHLPKRPTVDIQFMNLSYQVSEGRRKGYKTVLNGVNGKFMSGELTAIMGPSGAGKSTLMNVLAGYKSKNVTGSVTINGNTRNPRRFRKMSAYIMQDNCLSPNLTVNEAMKVAANLKLGKNVSEEKKEIVIAEILDTLSLKGCEETFTMNLSGGQRKRLSIALELVNNPPVMFFDEPTTGLDSASCFHCISLLKTLARGGRTIICTIHQPSARIFELFDHLYMMSEGNCIYRGQVHGLVPFLSRMNLYCPNYHNPADYVMEVACGEHGEYVQELVVAVNSGDCESYPLQTVTNDITKTNTSALFLKLMDLRKPKQHDGSEKDNQINISNVKTSSGTSSETLLSEDNTYIPTPGYMQFWILLKRTVFTILRDQALTKMRLIAHFIIGCILGLIYYNNGNNAAKVMTNSSCIFFTMMFVMYSAMMPTIMTFPMEISVFAKEHLNHWYSLKAYYFAKTIADVPFQILLTVSFILGIYYLTAQPMEATRFGLVLLISILTALLSQSVGLLIGAAFGLEAGIFLGPIAVLPSVLFSGFFANLNDIPKFISWISYVSYLGYSFEGAMIAIYGLDREKLVCEEIYCYFKDPKSFLDQLSLRSDMTSYLIDAGALVVFFIVARVSTYYVLRMKLTSLR